LSLYPAAVAPQLDLFSEAVRRDPYPFYRQLRDEQPVALIARLNWHAVTRFADVERVLRSPDEFSSTIMRGADRALLGQDPPAHTSVRKIAARAFGKMQTRALEERIRTTALSLVRGFVQAGGGDFVRDVAVELPVRIIAHLLGIDEERLPEFKSWSEAVVLGASGMIPPGREAEIRRRLDDFDHFFAELICRRRDQPGDDVVSALLQTPEIDPLEERDVRSLAKLLLIAGNETTTNLMANAVIAMFSVRGMQARLRDEPRLCSAWVEETLRFDAPVQIILRQPQLDVEIEGVLVPRGQVVAAVLGSANRDERHHPEPEVFRLDRTEPHLGFGAGPHFCLGSSLARLEATIGLSILLEETQHIEASESIADIPRMAALQLRGPQRLRIAVA
jgi:cytochrome P450